MLRHGNEEDDEQDNRVDLWQEPESDADVSDADSVDAHVKEDNMSDMGMHMKNANGMHMKNVNGPGSAAQMDRKFRVLCM